MFPPKRCNLAIPGPITAWDEAIPLGNGALGCLLWGPSQRLRFSVDRAGLWDMHRPDGMLTQEFTYQNLIALAREGNVAEIRRIFDTPYAFPSPTKIPAGRFYISGLAEKSYTATLDLQTAEAKLEHDGTAFLHAFMSMPTKVGCLRIAVPEEICATVERPAFGHEGEEHLCSGNSVEPGSLAQLQFPAHTAIQDGDLQGFVQPFPDGTAYALLLLQHKTQNGTEIFFTVRTAGSAAECERLARAELANACAAGYDALLQAHVQWWSAYWQESGISLPDERCEKLWYLANYFLASASEPGFAPMPLQGVWVADTDTLPPWKGDYHNDLNTQYTYCSYLKSNHIAQGRVFLDFLWDLREPAKAFAAQFYDTPGECLPSVMTIDGTALGGWPMYSLSPTNQIWLCQLFYEYYLATGNKEFLQKRVYPYFVGCAECISALLQPGKDGLLVLPISSSPEIHDDEKESWLTPNSNFDLALLRYLYGTLCEICTALRLNGQVWQEFYDKLPQLAVNEKHELMLSPDESLAETHRHFSHAMAFYPLALLDCETPENKQILKATVDQLVHFGSGQWVGFSFVWMAMLQIMQKNGAAAQYELHRLADYFLSVNGFHLNGDYKNCGVCDYHYRPFTLETNLFAAAAVQDMLLYSARGQLEILPAIPDAWRYAPLCFESLRGENGLLVSFSRSEKGACTLRLQAENDGQWYLKNTAQQISLACGEQKEYHWNEMPR